MTRFLKLRPIRIIGHPLVGPLLVPIICLLLFFDGLGSRALSAAPAGWLLLLLIGLLIALPLLDRDDDRSSLALGMALGIGILAVVAG